jgi:hypothetical protein
MTVEQVALTLIVAIATAFATSVLNNFFELRRLKTMWKRETNERIANYRRQRLESRLDQVQKFIENLLRINQTPDVLTLMVQEDVLQKLTDLGWSANIAYATCRAVDDGQLNTAMGQLGRTMPKTKELLIDRKVTAEDSEWADHFDKVLGAAGAVLDRIGQLPDEIYAQSLRQE